MSNHKVPPPFKKGDNFENWKKTIKIWQAVTPLEKSKQGAAIFLSLDHEAREAVLELGEDKISAETGVTHVLTKLDGLYQRDKTQLAFEALEEFDATKRKENESISDFCNKFELAYNKAKVYGTLLSTDVLAFRLLKAAGLREEQEELVKATVGELHYENMKAKLKRINMGPISQTNPIKEEVFMTEETFYEGGEEDEEEEVYYARQNVPDEFGRPTKCGFCQSIFHYVKDCPHASNARGRQRGGPSGFRGSFGARGSSWNTGRGAGRYARGGPQRGRQL